MSEPSQLDSVERAIEELRSAVATMPDLAYDGQGYFVHWSTIGRHHLGERIDDASRVFHQAVGDLSIAAASGPGEQGAGSLESSLWRMYSALDKLMVVCALILGVRSRGGVVELKGRAMGSNASATRDAPNLSDLGGKEPAARALTAIFSELSEVGGRSLRNEATHSLSQVGGPHALLDLDVRTIRADIEVARGARLLDTIQLKGVRLSAGISWKPRASQPGEFLSTPSASS